MGPKICTSLLAAVVCPVIRTVGLELDLVINMGQFYDWKVIRFPRLRYLAMRKAVNVFLKLLV